eukprot:Plantae.Rhodophyta-Purpureofilum_apyrenoidigerum.ctg8451.p1 GENE.Plantae.Rhodophyta-Purpureofilum_apyrenoidigerum.ctg8451~~Plantae.Rhodophyta-Purpureofilum_apyrenoidigerum.ctg8451.p1  ORF type:complete len:103 (+),score=13.33 Plantae.Rhodophyta-Purpureofilum_apyrenoidigerum.ctg8451:139-447(+)
MKRSRKELYLPGQSSDEEDSGSGVEDLAPQKAGRDQHSASSDEDYMALKFDGAEGGGFVRRQPCVVSVFLSALWQNSLSNGFCSCADRRMRAACRLLLRLRQ